MGLGAGVVRLVLHAVDIRAHDLLVRDGHGDLLVTIPDKGDVLIHLIVLPDPERSRGLIRECVRAIVQGVFQDDLTVLCR